MIPIPDTFAKPSYVYRLLARTPKAAIYEQWFQREDGTEKLHAYEVHKLRTQKHPKTGATIGRLASDADWGVWGLTYSTSLYGGGSAKTRAEAQLAAWSPPALAKT